MWLLALALVFNRCTELRAEIGDARLALPPLVVRTYVVAPMNGVELTRAEETIRTIFGKAALPVTLRTCPPTSPPPSCSEPVGDGEVVTRLVDAPRAFDPAALAYSVVDARQHAGTLVTVFVDRITGMADRASVDPATLLGRVMAHELGHLLIGTSGHSFTGLMRARWNDEELRANRPADWALAADDVMQVRRGVVERFSSLKAEVSSLKTSC